MKAYIITSGAVFALVTIAHIWRAIAEGPSLAKDPFFILLTLATAALSFWAWRSLKRASRC